MDKKDAGNSFSISRFFIVKATKLLFSLSLSINHTEMKAAYSTILIHILFYTIPLLIFGQSTITHWESCFGGSSTDHPIDLIQLGNEYLILAETYSNDGDISNNHGDNDIWLIKTDQTGNLIYEKCIGGSSSEGASKLLKINETEFYLVGYTSSNDGDMTDNPFPGAPNYLILKMNLHGEIIWKKIIGGSGIEWLEEATLANDQGIIVSGRSYSSDGDVDVHYGGQDIWIVKLDMNGSIEWDFTLGGTGNDYPGEIIQTSDGGYLAVGSTDGKGGGNYDTTCNFHGFPGAIRDVWIVRLDSNRNILWQQCYGGGNDDFGFLILESENGYLIVGSTISEDGDVSGVHHNGATQDIWVFEIDYTGELLWQKCLGGTETDYCTNVFITPDDGLMLVGGTMSNDGDVDGLHDELSGKYDVWFAKFNKERELTWQKCYGKTYDDYVFYGVIQKDMYHYVMALSTESEEWTCENHSGDDIRFVEISDSATSINEAMKSLNKVQCIISPNPAQNAISINYTLSFGNTEGKIDLRDVNGVLINSISVHSYSDEFQIATSSWSSGIYFCTISDTYSTQVYKIIITH